MKINNSSKKLNNKGFTLMELIVVLAIMVVMAGAAAVTVTMLDSSYVEDAERGIKDYVALGRTKSMSVAAKDWYVSVGKESGDYYVYLYKVVEESGSDKTYMVDKKKLGAKVSIAYKDAADGLSIVIGESTNVQMHFDAATGKIKSVFYDNNGDDANDWPGNSTAIGYFAIKRNDYGINLKVFFNTGKCERE